MAESTPDNAPTHAASRRPDSPSGTAAADARSTPSWTGLPTFARGLAANSRPGAGDAGRRSARAFRKSSSSGPARSSSSTRRATSRWSSRSATGRSPTGEVVKVGDKFGLRISGAGEVVDLTSQAGQRTDFALPFVRLTARSPALRYACATKKPAPDFRPRQVLFSSLLQSRCLALSEGSSCEPRCVAGQPRHSDQPSGAEESA